MPAENSASQWHDMLGRMLADFRRQHPDDQRSDRQLLHSLMDHFVASVLVKKSPDGKYQFPAIEGDIDEHLPPL